MPEPIRYGLANPHPLSQMKTELIWAGKYDAAGRKVAPVRVALPFQTVETVNESSQERQLALDLFSAGRPAEWRNRLIWGDKKYVLTALLEEFAGQVDLVYIDPPFATGANFSFRVSIEEETFEKEPSIIEQKAYRDTWGRGSDGYAQWLYETLLVLRDLLAETGKLFLHIDNRKVHHARLLLDEVFGEDNFRNQIAWKRTNTHGNAEYQLGQIFDSILFYAKSNDATINQLYQEYDLVFAQTGPVSIR
jgi:adenine specific DNA methylase Mod